MQKIVTLEGLKSFKEKLDGLFVRRELKTGSGTEYKTLSDNNLTDAMVEKIENAGQSSFSGAYADLSGKPTIGGKALVAGDNAPSALGLETPSGAQAKADAAKSGAISTVDSRGYQTASQVESAVAAKGYDTVSSVNSKVQAAKTELKASIDSAVASTYRPKGSAAFSALPALTAAKAGDVYNVSDAFTTTADFVEGAGKKHPAGTNVACVMSGSAKKWDVMAGFVDLSPYAKTADFQAVSTSEIDAMFA